VAALAGLESAFLVSPPTLVVGAAVALTLLLPVCIMPVLARAGGWTILAERYPASPPMPRPRTRFGYAIFAGWVGYNGALVVGSDGSGLFLSVWPLLAWAHPPVFIPWTEVERIEHRRRFAVRLHEIHVRRAPEVRFALRDRTYALVRDDAAAARVPGA
jgi:hypothetical protein